MDVSRRGPEISDDSDSDGGEVKAMPKVRFPKGKKHRVDDSGGGSSSVSARLLFMHDTIDPSVAASKRKMSRVKDRDKEFCVGNVEDYEVKYEDNDNFDYDGIKMEPFSLNNEREEGYFDEGGNFVEYIKKEYKDPWLESAQVDTSLAAKVQKKADEDDGYQDLTGEDIGKLKRKISNILQPGETIIQALKRLKNSSSEKGKMNDVTKEIFDGLAEAAMKLMENGEYNVYHEERETFEREAEGYERLARSRQVASGIVDVGNAEAGHAEGILADNWEGEPGSSSIWDVGFGQPSTDSSVVPVPSNLQNESFDMFGDDDGDAPTATKSEQVPPSPAENVYSSQNLADRENADGLLESGYVYDPSSGYYYNSSVDYYYDPASGLYCCASSGIWYAFDQDSGTYKEMPTAAPSQN